MKLSLDTIGYGGYFTAPGEQLPLEDAIRKAAHFGYDAACIYAHRPLGFPLDLDSDRRKRLKALYGDLDLEMGAIVCCTNFLEANHVLLYPQEKEILYVRECIRLAKDLGSSIVRILAGFYGYFQNPFAGQGYGLPSFESRSRRVSRGEDWLEAWHQVRRGIREVALYAQDEGVTLALQTHPEITMNNDDTLELCGNQRAEPEGRTGSASDRIGGPSVRAANGPADEGLDGLFPYDLIAQDLYSRWSARRMGGSHPWGRVGPSAVGGLPQNLPGDRLRWLALRRTMFSHHQGTQAGTIRWWTIACASLAF
jgi:sugar phosphate isomerase/epimerase